ncbi:hypothetical protein [Chelativorans intermedius]|uniref:Uncharacterized protein n=1 Tax=Chelativorans intermedius TaxID=515947 RepID=A0ABV6DB99_9HYPH|nr:hypothetical protein [Chelativorans intermedius]MCT8999190.1 hypothetical protein [Chelativorans intermedius]
MHAMEPTAPAALAAMEKALPLVLALAVLVAPLANLPLFAQGLDSEQAIEAIIGSDVKTEEAAGADQAERIVGAIENTLANAERVRKAFSLDTLEIIFLPDDIATGPIGEAIAAHEEEIQTLRQSIEGSAMFYHAVDSRSILLRDIVAVEFDDANNVTIFVNGSEQ